MKRPDVKDYKEGQIHGYASAMSKYIDYLEGEPSEEKLILIQKCDHDYCHLNPYDETLDLFCCIRGQKIKGFPKLPVELDEETTDQLKVNTEILNQNSNFEKIWNVAKQCGITKEELKKCIKTFKLKHHER